MLDAKKNIEFLKKFIADNFSTSGPVFLHSDIMYALPWLVRRPNESEGLLEAAYETLLEIFDDRPIWMPAFNYDFTTTGTFNVAQDPSQVGRLSEWFRVNKATWRSAVPVFSICGTNTKPDIIEEGRIDPFGTKSVFQSLYNNDGLIVFFGAPFAACTTIHFAERYKHHPIYRYDKIFKGSIEYESFSYRQVELLYHVRPLGKTLNYAWDDLLALLKDSGPVFDNGKVIIFSAPCFVDTLRRTLEQSTLGLLSTESREWIEASLEKKARNFFVLSDFE